MAHASALCKSGSISRNTIESIESVECSVCLSTYSVYSAGPVMSHTGTSDDHYETDDDASKVPSGVPGADVYDDDVTDDLAACTSCECYGCSAVLIAPYAAGKEDCASSNIGTT